MDSFSSLKFRFSEENGKQNSQKHRSESNNGGARIFLTNTIRFSISSDTVVAVSSQSSSASSIRSIILISVSSQTGSSISSGLINAKCGSILLSIQNVSIKAVDTSGSEGTTSGSSSTSIFLVSITFSTLSSISGISG